MEQGGCTMEKQGHPLAYVILIYKASGPQSTSSDGINSYHNLQVFKPFHLQSTSRLWAKSTIYSRVQAPIIPFLFYTNNDLSDFDQRTKLGSLKTEH